MRDLHQNFATRGLTVKTEKSTPGYILFHPSLGTSTYLADHDGKIVHEWKGEYNNLSLGEVDNYSTVLELELLRD